MLIFCKRQINRVLLLVTPLHIHVALKNILYMYPGHTFQVASAQLYTYIHVYIIIFKQKNAWAKLKKNFVWHCLPRVSLDRSAFFFFLIFTFCTWT